MTLAGLVIALGAVVDDAIIDVENILRRLRQHRAPAATGKSTASVILEASLEVRGPIVYATLIIVAAAVPVFLLDGLTGAFFRPLAVVLHAGHRRLDGGGADRHPGAGLILLRKAPVERRESPVVRVAAARLHRGCSPGSSHRPRRAYASFGVLVHRRRARGAAARPVAVPDLQGARLPDALDRRAGHVGRRGGSGSRPGQPGAAGRSRACAASARTSGRRSSARRSPASTSARTGSASTTTADYDETLGADPGGGRQLPGPLPRRR